MDPGRTDIDDRSAALLGHGRRNQANRPYRAQEVNLEPGVPVGIGDFDNGSARAVPGRVDQRINAPLALHGEIDQFPDIVNRLIGSRDPDSTQRPGECLTLTGR